jgi:hypothetical protein
VHGVAVVVDVRLALVLLGRVGMRLVLVGDRRVVVGVGMGGKLVLEVASVPQVVGDVHVLMVMDHSVVVMRIHAELLPLSADYPQDSAGRPVGDNTSPDGMEYPECCAPATPPSVELAAALLALRIDYLGSRRRNSAGSGGSRPGLLSPRGLAHRTQVQPGGGRNRRQPNSCVLDASLTRVNGNLAKVFGWNREWLPSTPAALVR